MKLETIHLPTVIPNLAPGALWVRLCTRHRLITEHALDAMPDKVGEIDAGLANREATRGGIVWLYIYDGDTGECVCTLVTAK